VDGEKSPGDVLADEPRLGRRISFRGVPRLGISIG